MQSASHIVRQVLIKANHSGLGCTTNRHTSNVCASVGP